MCKFKKVVTIVGNLLFFGGYFYVIFFGFMCPPNVSTRAEAIKWLLVSFGIAVLLPGIICFQAHDIRRLEKENEEYRKCIEKFSSLL